MIFTLSVSSRSPIPEFQHLSASPGRRQSDGDFFYEFGASSSVDDMWGERAHSLDATVSAALDRLDQTGIDPDELATDDRIVSARFSVSPGAENIHATVVRRLARIHANILMDSWG